MRGVSPHIKIVYILKMRGFYLYECQVPQDLMGISYYTSDYREESLSFFDNLLLV